MVKQELGPLQLKWIEALESGEYEQGSGILCQAKKNKPRKYCCLGVGCHLLDFKEEYLGVTIYFNGNADTSSEFASKMGLRDGAGGTSFVDQDEQDKFEKYIRKNVFGFEDAVEIPEMFLTYLNDCGASFLQIAKLLRKFPSVYFKEVK
jgi:hypothetical protein